MQVISLRIENFRNIASAELALHARLNVFRGDNGAGKTSVLEAVYVVARGRSFRTARPEELIGAGTGAFRIFLAAERAGISHRIGLERNRLQWKARRDGQDVPLLSDLSRDLPLVLMEPNSHLLVGGAPDGRRRFLDWGLFHVEPAYLDLWRRYARALKQRNAALRAGENRVLDGLDTVLAEAGERLTVLRQAYVDRLAASFASALEGEKAVLQDIALSFQQGWKGDGLLSSLKRSRTRDLEQGATSVGPHRAEIAMLRDGHAVRSLLSRGEQKAVAAALLLTQAKLLAEKGERALFLVDDLQSEFDAAHVESVMAKALVWAGQVWVTGVAPLAVGEAHALFHVEHGTVLQVV